MPAKIAEDSGGVHSRPLITAKMFSPEASATWPLLSSMMASS